MNSILDIIKPITLLRGSHRNTARTGQGCFMNVIAYLNGEAQITDESPCVCPTVRSAAIWLNDRTKPADRQRLVPLIERAMGSATEDDQEMERRYAVIREFAADCAVIAWQAADCAADREARARSWEQWRMINNAAKTAKACADRVANPGGPWTLTSSVQAGYMISGATYDAGYALDKAREAAIVAGIRSNRRRPAERGLQLLIERVFKYLDDVLPPAAEPTPVIMQRAAAYVALATTE